MALATPNHQRASLARWVALASGAEASAAEDRERAQRCLTRYVHPAIAPAAGANWTAWYDARCDELVFVDSAGFYWMLDPAR